MMSDQEKNSVAVFQELLPYILQQGNLGSVRLDHDQMVYVQLSLHQGPLVSFRIRGADNIELPWRSNQMSDTPNVYDTAGFKELLMELRLPSNPALRAEIRAAFHDGKPEYIAREFRPLIGGDANVVLPADWKLYMRVPGSGAKTLVDWGPELLMRANIKHSRLSGYDAWLMDTEGTIHRSEKKPNEHTHKP